MEIKTYVIKTLKGEFYCGKTRNLYVRIQQHKNEKKPHWFGFKERYLFIVVMVINGDYEKEIKRFGVKKYYESLLNYNSKLMVSLS